MKRLPILYGTAFAAGMLVWVLITMFSGRREAWDSEMYFSFGIPVLCLAAAVLGFLEPQQPWRWGLTPMLGQAVWMFSSQGVGNLWPLGLAAFGMCAIPLIVTARIGAGLSKRFSHV